VFGVTFIRQGVSRTLIIFHLEFVALFPD
jgi:hypothetical protein